MVDEKRVGKSAKGSGKNRAAFVADSEVCHINGITIFKHPKFGVVTVHIGAITSMDTPRSIKKWQANFRTFVKICVENINIAGTGEER